MNKFKVNISGMTCTGCEKHVESALEKIGAKNIESSYRRGEAVFELPDDIEVESAIKAIDEANYQAGEIEEVSSLENVALINEDNYDLLIIGSGAAAFSSAIKAIEYGAKVGMIERGTVGGTCVNIGCVPSKGATFERVEQSGEIKRVYVTVNGSREVIESDQLLVATGRKPNTDSLNLSAAGVETGKNNEILINDFGQTSNEKIYAAGDVTLGPQFVYVAAYEGGIITDNAIGGLNKKIDLSVVPAVTFTNPTVATVGLTEEQAKEKGYDVKTSVLPLDAVPRAIVNRETTGVFKLVADAETLKVLGVHIVSENAGDVIYAASLAVKFGLTIEDLTETLAPYLTMAEGLKLVALTFDKDISKLSCCAG